MPCWIVAFVLSAFFSTPDLLSVVVSGEAGSRLDIHLSALADAGFSGTVLVARGGEILLHKGYGLADRQREIPARPDTIFDIGSITKQFTAAAILKLEMMGKLSTDDTLADHFDTVPPDKAGITLHQLLTHTSGLDHGYGEDTDYAPRDLALKVFFEMPLLDAPGKAYQYSNPGYSILAAIVENVSGTTYERFLAQELFHPAGMTETGYVLPDWDMSRMTRNYDGDEDHGFTFNRSWGPEGPYWHCYGNGCILTTTGDLFRWETALQSAEILSEDARRKLWEPHVAVSGGASYGYGWRIAETTEGSSYIGHGGGSGFGVWAAYYRFPQDQLLVLVLSNQRSVPGEQSQEKLIERLAALARGEAR